MGLPRENNRVSIQGRSQNRVGFDGNPLGSDAKPEVMPEGGVEPEIRSEAHHRARERRDGASKGAGKREERPGPRGGRLRAKNGVNHDITPLLESRVLARLIN